MPSALRPLRVEREDRMADRWGGTKPSSASTSTVTSLATRTSNAVAYEGSDRPWVSRPISRPVDALRRPVLADRLSRRSDVIVVETRLETGARCPDVPKLTCCPGSSGSGCSV